MAEAASFGSLVKRARKALDLSQKELAARVGCAVVTIQKIEEGQRRPSRQVAELICQSLELSEEETANFLKLARTAKPPAVLEPEPPLGNLPAPPAPFIGRVEESEALRARLLDPRTRLVTVVGPPGVGKTRLSIETAAACAPAFANGAWFVPLAALQDPALVLPTLARTLNISDPAAGSQVTRLADLLRGQSLLLVLDNWEHLLAGALVVSELLTACPKIKVLATSRLPLELYGETLFALDPLRVPTDCTQAEVETLVGYDSVALFFERARAVRPQLMLNTENAGQMAQLCCRLEGLPLAIELAAAGLYREDLPGLLAQVEAAQGPLNALHASPRDFNDRQRSLQNTIGWSYQLLAAEEQSVYRALSVFRGSFSPEAAQVVSGVHAADSILRSLARHHLVREVSGPGNGKKETHRCSMLELIHADALERATQAGEIGELRRRHAEWYLETMTQGAREWKPQELLSWASVEVDNLRAALEWLLEQGDARKLLQLCTALRSHWEFSGYQREGKGWLEKALSLSAGEPLDPDSGMVELRAQALLDGCVLAFQQGDYQAAQVWGEEGLRLFTLARNTGQQALLQLTLGRIAIEQGDYPAAEEWEQRSLQLFRSLGSAYGTAGSLVHLAEVALGRDEDALARRLAEDCLKTTSEPGSSLWLALAHTMLGEVALRAGDAQAAFRQALAGLEWALGMHAVRVITLVLALAAAAAAHLAGDAAERARQAARLWGAVIHIRESRGITFSTGHQKRFQSYFSSARNLLGPEAWAREEHLGKKLSLEESVQFARKIK